MIDDPYQMFCRALGKLMKDYPYYISFPFFKVGFQTPNIGALPTAILLNLKMFGSSFLVYNTCRTFMFRS